MNVIMMMIITTTATTEVPIKIKSQLISMLLLIIIIVMMIMMVMLQIRAGRRNKVMSLFLGATFMLNKTHMDKSCFYSLNIIFQNGIVDSDLFKEAFL